MCARFCRVTVSMMRWYAPLGMNMSFVSTEHSAVAPRLRSEMSDWCPNDSPSRSVHK